MGPFLEVLKIVGIVAGTTTPVVWAIAWLVRQLVRQGLDRDLEAYKARLRSEHDKELEQFAVLHRERAVVLAETYRLLVRARRAARDYLVPFEPGGAPDKEERWRTLAEHGNQLVIYFDEHRIYFSDHFCKAFDECCRAIKDPCDRFDITRRLAKDGEPGNSASRNLTKAWSDGWKQFQERVPGLEAEIRARFRKLLGVPDESGANGELQDLLGTRARDPA